MKKLLLLFVLAWSLGACDFDLFSPGTHSVHLALGNPSDANRRDDNNYLLLKDEMAISYNRSKLVPNWVAWHLDGAWIRANTEREGSFRADESLPKKWKKAMSDYYTRTGFDRGHLCPAGDRTRSTDSQEATFVMTNIVPQAPALNRGLWVEIEKECRNEVQKGNELYIYSGTQGIGGKGSSGFAELLKGGVVVPEYLWKVIVILPEGNSDAVRVDEGTRVITLLVPNREEAGSKRMDEFVITLSQLEQLTGHHFLPDNYGMEVLKEKRYNFQKELGTSAADKPCGSYNSKVTYLGSRGGCYYLGTSGDKVYVGQEYCSCK
ncbi:DNA/RNA non-specific endonuclease [Telluribacter sp. SYSU D00476]|uniref:DNA/RNA non-specific endonuclease n=1 Tax=Telluribacter sp. SYSU D00476 TaxID=2811430 RepID=UPI001FF5E3DA|nr:DNA/RNA non-specific endonuclease [Telluribacter sp. SYSU D00476]